MSKTYKIIKSSNRNVAIAPLPQSVKSSGKRRKLTALATVAIGMGLSSCAIAEVVPVPHPNVKPDPDPHYEEFYNNIGKEGYEVVSETIGSVIDGSLKHSTPSKYNAYVALSNGLSEVLHAIADGTIDHNNYFAYINGYTSVQKGVGRGKNALAMGRDSYSFAANGIAIGKGAVAIGDGRTREKFENLVQENKKLIEDLNENTRKRKVLYDEKTRLREDLSLNEHSLKQAKEAYESALGGQDETAATQERESSLIRLLDAYRNNHSNRIRQRETLDEITTSRNQISTPRYTLKTIIHGLNLDQFDNTDEKALELAKDLKNKIEFVLPAFSGKYSVQEYKDMINSYIRGETTHASGGIYWHGMSSETVSRVDAINNELSNTVTEFSDLTKSIEQTEKELADVRKRLAEDNYISQADIDSLKRNYQEMEERVAVNKKSIDNISAELDENAKKDRELNEVLEKTFVMDIGNRSQAYGYRAFASGDDAIAMGSNATITGTQSISIGKDAAITGNNVFSAGNNNNISSNDVVAVGNNITVGSGLDGAVVLGTDSAATVASPVSSAVISGKTYNFAGKSPASTVSIGSAGKERQIKNVAAGALSADSTDAVNGSQLYALAESLKNTYVKPSTQDVSDEVGKQLGNKLKSGNNINIRHNDDGSFTIEAQNTQSVTKGGEGISVKAEDNAQGTKDYTVSAKIGNGLKFDENGNIVVKAGGGLKFDENGNLTVVSGNNATTPATSPTLSGGTGIKVTETDNADGTKNYAVSTKIGNGLTFDGNGSVMLDKNLTADTISVGGIALTTKGIDAGGKAIGNVGAGQIAPESRDAVNGGQMYQIVNLLGNHHAQINGNTQNIQGLRQEVSRIDGKISQMDKQLKRGLSVAGAIGMLAQPTLAGNSMVAVAVNRYQGEQAVAVGYSKLSENGKHVFKLSGSFNVTGSTIKEAMIGSTYGYQWF